MRDLPLPSRYFDDQVLTAEGKVWPAAAFHVLRGRLRKGGNDNRQRYGRVAIYVRGQRATSQLAVHQRLIKRDGAAAPAAVGRVGGDLNRVLVAVNLLLEDVRGHFCLA